MAKARQTEEAGNLLQRLACTFLDHDKDQSLSLDEYELPEVIRKFYLSECDKKIALGVVAGQALFLLFHCVSLC